MAGRSSISKRVTSKESKFANFPSDIEEFVAALKRPIALRQASGEWMSARDVKAKVEEICSVDSAEALQAICRRAVIAIPINALTWVRSEDPHDYIDRFEYFRDRESDLSHFSRPIYRQAFEEIMEFFKVLERKATGKDHSPIKHASWQTGDFKLVVERDFSDVTLEIVGLQFDSVALLEAFAGGIEPVASKLTTLGLGKRGRPPSPAWPDWIAELVAYIHEHGFPAGEGSQGQEALITAISDRLAVRGLESPSRATVQAAARAVLERLRSLDG